ncbi:28 kDa heat- and acid-stable phosphoprotein isoform X1 [Octopus bimaculoides]|uniref:Casein kinase substrate phosphoprotein PP28 domain-containing protein n=2 Tax=Octopus bimaculoides TaxID=37653 RepID=A0A0L8GQW1_OCTBM|nr:28 kDa heat- and acid-stable phosphoprotein isoform X1 [Octopus bimaculoides]|eukprot:XP_014778930.1 PREDICTED: 28 kDa heat- and acid-stable phosphoprotein-like isoform X1 [Octopus bimaculoides]
MPRGGSTAGRGKKSHKGQRRMFTNEEELAQQHEEEKKKAWRKQKGLDCEEGNKSGSSSSEESDSGEESKSKGVGHLIDIDNPNRVVSKTKKATTVSVEANPAQGLSRREREEIEKQQARIRYQQLHVMGKTEEARADLARLALIKKQREESAKRREDDKKAKDNAKSTANKLKGKS